MSKNLINPNKSSMATGFSELLNSDILPTEEDSPFSSDFFVNLLKENESKFKFEGKIYYLHLLIEKDVLEKRKIPLSNEMRVFTENVFLDKKNGGGKRKVLLSDEMGQFMGDLFLNVKDGSWEAGNFKNPLYRSILAELQKYTVNTRIALGIDTSNKKTSSEALDTLT